MILAIDTSTAACTAALLGESGSVIARADEQIGRGHSERLVPMLAEMLDGKRPGQILVGVGPGSFTGIRVGIAAAHGLCIGWKVPLLGLSSLALLCAGVGDETPSIAGALQGGHGELFVQQFDTATGLPQTSLWNLPPSAAAKTISADLVVGPGARQLVEARGWGTARDLWPSAARALGLHEEMRTMAPKPLYARAPDAGTRRAA